MAEFTDASLSVRGRLMALWLCDISNRALSPRDRAASCDLLLEELPDTWTAEDCCAESDRVRMEVGGRASHRAWLAAMGWLVNQEECLPARPPQGLSIAARETAQRKVRSVLVQLARRVA